jgi:hypothetical protein
MSFVEFLAIFVVLFAFSHARVLLYDTEISIDIEYFDCIYHTEDSIVKYCRRLSRSGLSNRPELECANGGQKLFFNNLLEKNISSTEILQWSSSIERADDYMLVFSTIHKTMLLLTLVIISAIVLNQEHLASIANMYY